MKWRCSYAKPINDSHDAYKQEHFSCTLHFIIHVRFYYLFSHGKVKQNGNVVAHGQNENYTRAIFSSCVGKNLLNVSHSRECKIKMRNFIVQFFNVHTNKPLSTELAASPSRTLLHARNIRYIVSEGSFNFRAVIKNALWTQVVAVFEWKDCDNTGP